MTNQNNTNAYGLQFREAYHTQFTIPDYLTESLTIYKYLKWDAAFFLAQWESNIGTYAAGTIRRYNQIFHVQFAKDISLGKIKSLLDNGNSFQVALSFRKTNKLPAMVIVDFVASAREFSVIELVDSEKGE
jgi:hypothetical protein